MPRTRTPDLAAIATYALLAVILLAGLALRTWNVNFDRGIGSHPDERSTACFYAPGIGLPASWDEFVDPKRSPLNPLWDPARQERRSFTYGHFPLYLGVAVAELMHRLAPVAEKLGGNQETVALMARGDQGCDAIAVAGRLTMALLDTLTILLVFLLGRAVYGRAAGLLAAAFYAFSAQAVQLSHFFAMDPASTTFTVLAVLGAVRTVQRRTYGAAVLAGLGAGLAIASKFSALPILAAPVAAGLAIAWQAAQEGRANQRPPDGRAQLFAVLSAAVAIGVAVIAFALASPYAVLDWRSFLQATLVEQGRMVRGVADMPFTRQYRNTTPYLYFIEQQVRWGLGWPLGVVVSLGVLAGLARGVRSLWRMGRGLLGPRAADLPRVAGVDLADLVVWSWVIPYFAITGAFLAKFNRYMIPLLPFAAYFAAALIWHLWQRNVQSPNVERSNVSTFNVRRTLAAALAAVGVAGGLLWSLAYVDGVYGREHTWIAASRWLYQNAPAGSVILWELWDDPLPKAIPGEPGMDMGSAGLRHIDWSPYEEDTAAKYALMKEKLREADFVAYSSKRIYDSVDELPARYPMTNRYYDAMWDGRLGFELALDQTSPPRLLGWTFEDRGADESWSLYDHPQVTIFRKVRDLSDAEYDVVFDRVWESATPWDRGADSPLSPLLAWIGLGSSPESEKAGLINRLLALLTGEGDARPAEQASPLFGSWLPWHTSESLAVVDDYRWNHAASASPLWAAAWWWLVMALLGWLAWPICFVLLAPLRDRGYLISRGVGWLVAGWLLWLLASAGVAENSVRNAWLTVLALGVVGGLAAWRVRRALWAYVQERWAFLLAAEALFALAYAAFILVRMGNPDLWQPWFGGEKFMEFAFLNGILRSPTFPPVDPHFAGGYINYYYFGLYLVAYLIKLTGIYAEVAFNLVIPTLFALTVTGAFAVAYSAVRPNSPPAFTGDDAQDLPPPAANPPEDQIDAARAAVDEATPPPDDPAPPTAATVSADAPAGAVDGGEPLIAAPAVDAGAAELPTVAPPDDWRRGFAEALLAPLFVVILGNLDGFAQALRSLAQAAPPADGELWAGSVWPGLATLLGAARGLGAVLAGDRPWPPYDFWGPSRVIPSTINEFPYWSFLFADLHPHLIGIPFSLAFLALILALLHHHPVGRPPSLSWPRGLLLLLGLAAMLGTLASVNLWELPTYLGLALIAYLAAQFRSEGRVHLLRTAAVTALFAGGAYLLFLPFFRNFANVGASGVGLARAGDGLGAWLLIWGFLLFILASWLVYAAARPAHRAWATGSAAGDRAGPVQPGGGERWLGLVFRRYDRLPRAVYLHRLLVVQPSFGYLCAVAALPLATLLALAALIAGRTIMALCLLLLGVAFLLLWRRARGVDAGDALAAVLLAVGLAILAGTQLVYLKDFLQGSDWYRMNTLFKFFSQTWVIWGVAAAIALPRFWSGLVGKGRPARADRRPSRWRAVGVGAWSVAFVLLLTASLAYPLWGTPARLEQRFDGWRPAFGTLNALDFMRQGVYTWPDDSHPIELRHDWQAIQWLLANVRGNAVIVESAQVDYYRAGGVRVASLTGLSGLRGPHVSEQRPGEQVGARDGLHREFWTTPDVARTQQIMDELAIALVYVGQLERHEHPEGVAKLEAMAQRGLLEIAYANDGVTLYLVPGALARDGQGVLMPPQ